MSLAKVSLYKGVEAEGRWRGLDTLFVNMSFPINQERTADDFWAIMEAYKVGHVYFGTRQSFQAYDICVKNPELVVELAQKCRMLVTCERLFGTALDTRYAGPRIRTIFTILPGMEIPLLGDHDIKAFSALNAELKIDADLVTGVWSYCPQVLDLHYCTDENIEEIP